MMNGSQMNNNNFGGGNGSYPGGYPYSKYF